MTQAFRDQLFEATAEAAFPAEPVLDDVTGEPVLDAESASVIARVFDLFGVTALPANDADLDRVLNTACTLSAEVALHVQELSDAGGDIAALPDAAHWHDDYRGYVSALWQGDRGRIARQAAALGLQNGIPNGSLPLHDGPLA